MESRPLSPGSEDAGLDLLNELAAGEDEFDVDLMACGCRLRCDNSPTGFCDAPVLTEWGIAAFGVALTAVGSWVLSRQPGPSRKDIDEIVRLHGLKAPDLARWIDGLVDDAGVSAERLQTLAAGHSDRQVVDGEAARGLRNAAEIIAAYGLTEEQQRNLLLSIVAEGKVTPRRAGAIAEGLCMAQPAHT